MEVGQHTLTLDLLASYFQNKISSSDTKMFDLGKEAGPWCENSPVCREQQEVEIGKAILMKEI